MTTDTKPTIPEVLPMVRAYYAKPGNGVGGSLHVVLEDGNCERGDVEWCLAYAIAQADGDGAALARVLLKMSETQRRKLAGLSFYPS